MMAGGTNMCVQMFTTANKVSNGYNVFRLHDTPTAVLTKFRCKLLPLGDSKYFCYYIRLTSSSIRGNYIDPTVQSANFY